jgi:hypothetical protein
MKLRISTIFLGVSMLVAGASCIKKDNYPGPNASLQGNLFLDGSGSKNTIQTSTNAFQVRLEQLDWSATPAPQDIPVKYDGTYENSQLFSGHYRVSIKGGAFWAVAPQEIDIRNGTKLDFQLTPYLLLNNITAEMVDSVTLKLHCDLEATINGGIPSIISIFPYVNTTKIVGPGAAIFEYSEGLQNPLKNLNKEWANLSAAEKSPDIIIPGMLRGRTFFVRVGVKFNNDDKSYNLSEIIQVDVPK